MLRCLLDSGPGAKRQPTTDCLIPKPDQNSPRPWQTSSRCARRLLQRHIFSNHRMCFKPAFKRPWSKQSRARSGRSAEDSAAGESTGQHQSPARSIRCAMHPPIRRAHDPSGKAVNRPLSAVASVRDRNRPPLGPDGAAYLIAGVGREAIRDRSAVEDTFGCRSAACCALFENGRDKAGPGGNDALEGIRPIREAQLLTCLKPAGCKLGLLTTEIRRAHKETRNASRVVCVPVPYLRGGNAVSVQDGEDLNHAPLGAAAVGLVEELSGPAWRWATATGSFPRAIRWSKWRRRESNPRPATAW